METIQGLIIKWDDVHGYLTLEGIDELLEYIKNM